jgi:hypothetical protein
MVCQLTTLYCMYHVYTYSSMINVITLFDVVVKDNSKRLVGSPVPSGKAKILYFILSIRLRWSYKSRD